METAIKSFSFISHARDFLCIVMMIGIFGCDAILSEAPAPDQSFDSPIDGLTNEQRTIFTRGDDAFSQVFTFQSGLGPIFNQASCERCHIGDGRGHPRTNLKRFGNNLSNGMFAAKQQGFYAQAIYPLFHSILPMFPQSVLSIGGRYDYIDLDAGVKGADVQRLTLGINLRLVLETLFKLDYQHNWNFDRIDNETRSAVIQFGVATYF